MPVVKAPPESGDLDAFASETDAPAPVSRRPTPRLQVGAGAVVVMALGGFAFWSVGQPSSATTSSAAPAATTGSLRIETDPSGAEVHVDGQPPATTPASFTLSAGSHAVVVRHGEYSRQVTVTIRPGAEVVHQIAWPAEAAATGGTLVAETAAPVAPRRPEVAVVAPGWMTVESAVPLQIYEGGRLIGISEADRIMLPAGEHALELAAVPLGFRTRQTVRITPNGTARVGVELPRVALAINAVPWADVSIDGVPVGQTPIGDLMQPIGTHELEFRHPQLGTKRTRVTLSLTETARVAMDMRSQ